MLDAATINDAQALGLRARYVVEGYMAGEHKSPFRGFSVEFTQHREYVPGDDTRHLDWKVLGRTDRYYLKQYEQETNYVAHILLDGTTYALGRGSLTVGREPGEEPAIRLPEGLAGISRRHCTFVREGAETVLVDHSRCGTLVNGERIAERARVRAGDRVRVGEPGVELALISVTEASASDERHNATA